MARSSTSFQAGNQAARRHGLKTAEARARKDEIRALLKAHLSDFQEADGPLLDLAVGVVHDLRQAREFIDSRGGMVNRRDQVLNAAQLYRGLMKDALAIFDRLGIGPVARANVLAAVSVNPRDRVLADLSELQKRYALKPAEKSA